MLTVNIQKNIIYISQQYIVHSLLSSLLLLVLFVYQKFSFHGIMTSHGSSLLECCAFCQQGSASDNAHNAPKNKIQVHIHGITSLVEVDATTTIVPGQRKCCDSN